MYIVCNYIIYHIYNADVTDTIYSINYVFNCMFVGLMWIWLVSNDNYR
jgi:hypothetical protein